MKNSAILLNKRPVGRPTMEDFKFVEQEVPAIKDGEFLLKTLYVSVDPYLRGRMIDAKSYVPPFQLNEPMSSGVIAEVIESKNPKFKIGTFVSGYLDWKEYNVSTGAGLTPVDPNAASITAYLGILGMTGLTAYLGLKNIGSPKQGETLVVSGAAGAVGSVVGQIGKIMGCKVIGIAGTDEKVALLKDKFGFDEGINYKTTDNMTKAIQAAAPNGVDIYFDNVGGDISDAVMFNLNRLARVVVCGSISGYNDTERSVGPRMQWKLISTSSLMKGFTIGDYANEFPHGMETLTTWLAEGKLAYTETIVKGFDQIPQAFLDLFDGKNEGKMIVKI
ncbi:NADPH-dependent curcumin reductase CurA [Pedobacter sp. CAN_A7]|uniref:NADP-dependent oxidoreductase n=1 Tax=Pedobacter sp. CAN_A7 TaxID=2787722 RepID=UPI0018CB5A84